MVLALVCELKVKSLIIIIIINYYHYYYYYYYQGGNVFIYIPLDETPMAGADILEIFTAQFSCFISPTRVKFWPFFE